MNVPTATIRGEDSGAAASGLAMALTLASLLAPPLSAASVSVGLSPVRSQLVQTFPFGSGGPDPGDGFGMTLASGDFNGDGIADLASGVPFDAVDFGSGTVAGAGSVYVHLGAPGAGLASASGWFRLSQASGANTPAEEEQFGFALAAGDFDNDGFDDLAVGVPRDVQGGVAKGGVQVFFGSADPAVFGPGVVLGIGGSANDYIGLELTAGHFDDDNYEDLAVGIPGRDAVAGAVFVMYGGSGGLGPGGQFLQQSNPDIEDNGEPDDRFGWALAAHDWNGDGRDDLAVGVPLENGYGAVQLFFGGENGLDLVHDILWTQNSIAGTSEPGDFFGSALTTGDFDGDGYGDLVIGSYGEDFGLAEEITDAGTVAAVFGDPAGFDLARTVAWGQGGFIGLDVAEPNDLFGYSMTTGDFDHDGFDDLIVSHPGEAWSQTGDGAVTALLGGANPFQQSRSRLFAPGHEGVPGSTSQPGTFGAALAAGDFDGDHYADLVIGVPSYGADPKGAEIVLYGGLAADGFDTGNATYWSAVTP
ncbi:MAG: FG-GAP repeat protein [Thermoanaerobaculia bacterium]|nr:FG-GAP repeat protein [Thermoanaerobaculia bacterium]MBP9824474.1 FG-GAP repeat protein [Thermoanaerobaculia bacterium]